MSKQESTVGPLRLIVVQDDDEHEHMYAPFYYSSAFPITTQLSKKRLSLQKSPPSSPRSSQTWSLVTMRFGQSEWLHLVEIGSYVMDGMFSSAEKAVNDRLDHTPELYLLALAQFAIAADTEVVSAFRCSP